MCLYSTDLIQQLVEKITTSCFDIYIIKEILQISETVNSHKY